MVACGGSMVPGLLGLKYDQMTGHVVSLAEKHNAVGFANTLV